MPEPTAKARLRPNRGARLALRQGMRFDDKLSNELEHLRRELRERETEANELAERIASLQKRIDLAMSRLDRAQDKRLQQPDVGASKK